MTTAAKRTAAANAALVRTASGRFTMAHSLADPALKDQLEAFRRKNADTPEASKKFLQHVGILNKSGNLSRKFGG